MSLSSFYEANGRSTGVDPDYKKALKYIEEEFKSNPEAKKKRIVLYSRIYALVNKDDAQNFYEKQIESTSTSKVDQQSDGTKIS